MRCSGGYQHDRETVAAFMSVAAGDLEGAVLSIGKELFQFVGVLRVADAIAEQNHAVFEITGLPCVQKMIRGCERKHVTLVRRIFLFGRMAV